jgi:signal transduction histidine kinase
MKNKKIEKTNNNWLIPILSHDLKSPINTIIGFSSLALESLQNNDSINTEKFLKIILKQAKIAKEQILSIAEWNFEINEMIEEKDFFNISQLIDKLIGNYSELVEQKNITIRKIIEIDKNKILGNKKAVEIIIRNLISNALKFTKQNGLIEIFALNNNNNETIEIIVKDNGIGIPKHKITDIFKKQEPRPGTNNEKGFGIGLSLCKKIIDKLQEKIWVKSEKNIGTEFHFTISQKNINFETNDKI